MKQAKEFLLIGVFFMLCVKMGFAQNKTMADSVFSPGDRISLPKLVFLPDKYSLSRENMDSLRLVYEFLKKYPFLVVEVINYTDHRCDECSQDLPGLRANAIRDSLVRMGIDRKRLLSTASSDRPLFTQQDIRLPGGKTIPRGTMLTEQFRDQYKGNKKDYEFLRFLARRTELKIVRTDFGK